MIRPFVDTHELRRIADAEAIALVDELLGPPEAWSASDLMKYRLTSDFQSVWKAEVGHWLHAAKVHSALPLILANIHGERDRKKTNELRITLDPRHRKLHQHLAAAMVCHYFTGLTWTCDGFDTETGADIDIDLALRTPGGTLVELQVKAPGKTGRMVPTVPLNGEEPGVEFVEEDNDQEVISALDKAVGQLPKPARSVAMVAMFARRVVPLSWQPSCIRAHVYGRTVPTVEGRVLPRENFGHFLTGEWNQVAGVMMFDWGAGIAHDEDENGGLRFTEVSRYSCTVFLNPKAEHPADPAWFPRARVVVLEDDAFRWIPEPPTMPSHGLPPGTRIVEEPPDRA